MENNDDQSGVENLRDARTKSNEAISIIASKQLFGDEREVGIEHAGAIYRLKITKQGKLILNK